MQQTRSHPYSPTHSSGAPDPSSWLHRYLLHSIVQSRNSLAQNQRRRLSAPIEMLLRSTASNPNRFGKSECKNTLQMLTRLPQRFGTTHTNVALYRRLFLVYPANRFRRVAGQRSPVWTRRPGSGQATSGQGSFSVDVVKRRWIVVWPTLFFVNHHFQSKCAPCSSGHKRVRAGQVAVGLKGPVHAIKRHTPLLAIVWTGASAV